MGGIEVHLYKWMKYFSEKGVKVIWYALPHAEETTDFSELLQLNIEIKHVRKTIFGLQYEELDEVDADSVVMLSFDPLWYIAAEKIRCSGMARDFIHYMVLPHFKGAAYFPEENCLTERARKNAWIFMRRKYEEWNRQGCLKSFNEKQYLACSEHYSLCPSQTNHIIPYVPDAIYSDAEVEERARIRAERRSSEFQILVCSRLDFPHKGYVLGMVDVFESLRAIYPNVSLTIVGDGPSRQELEARVSALSKNDREFVYLLGTLSPERLIEQFGKASVNPNLAGALRTGATCGVPSLTMRHYTTCAECYGYYEDTKLGKELRSDSGIGVKPFIEQLILMSSEEYVAHCVAAAKRAKEGYGNPDDLFEISKDGKNVTANRDRRFGQYLLLCRSFSARVLGKNQFV